MKRSSAGTMGLITVVVGWAWPAALSGQVLIDGTRTAIENARAAGARAPGRMVNAGLARAQERADAFRARHTITEQEGGDIRTTLVVAAVQELFRQVNGLVDMFIDILRRRDGLPPLSRSPATGGSSAAVSAPRSVGE